ncbi:MAG: hypothetical protein IH863_02870 [Chloroflexi bacterium]|nr:hypothetical protein [Chloroflexota bacterium]
MKTTAVATTLSLLAALLLTLSLALACGGDDGEVNATSSPGGGNTAGSNGDGDSFSGYFADLQRIFEDADDATNEAEEPLNETSPEAELDAQLSALDTYLGEIDTVFNEAIGRLEGLSVPAAAADDHQDFIDGARESLTAGNALRNELTDITTDEQFDDHLAGFDSDIDAAIEKADAACLALQKIADTEDVGVDLDC